MGEAETGATTRGGSKIVLVTGASSGIGLATALRFARSGHEVIAAVRDPERAPALREALASLPQSQPLAIRIEHIDVTEDGSVTAGVQRIREGVGAIDVLINNAGISMSAALEVAPLRDARRIFEVNYFGAIRMIQAVLPDMRQRRSGAIVNVSSISGLVPVPALAHYSASKAALESATEVLAQEVSRFGVRVMLVEPGVVKTPMYTRRSNLRPIDPKSPYLEDLDALYKYFKRGLRDPLTADDVARSIEDAVAADTPRFRYLLGKDAEALVRERRRFSDEEWLEGPPEVKALLSGGSTPGD
jgi:NAD(P)-dependent dehydrogenase (short-subunit alcohol dehydrogenase family)